MQLRLCVLGCGAFAATFARAMAELGDEIALYFASRDLNRAREYVARFGGVDAFGSYEAAAAHPDVDALYVCTPHHLHREHVALGLSRGKPVLVEKPIAGSLADAEAMVRQAEAAGVPLMVAENYRFLPAVQQAKALIDAGRLGPLRLIQLHEQYPFQPAGWRSRPELNGGGVLIDGGIHKVSALSFLAGRPHRVYAKGILPGQPGLAAEDGVVIVTDSDAGVVGVINHSWSVAPPSPHSWVSIDGAQASLYFEVGRPWLRLTEAGGATILELPHHPNGLVPMAREFRQCLREGRRPAMDGAAGIADLALVLKAYESMATGGPALVD